MSLLVRQYCQRVGWEIGSARHLLMVEGESDHEFFCHASKLNVQRGGEELVGRDLAIIVSGQDDDGGVDGILRKFPTLYDLAAYDMDPDRPGHRFFRVAALLDGDPAGKGGVNNLTQRHMRLKLWRDVFLLQRSLPTKTRELNTLKRSVEKANHLFQKLECVVEDLICPELVSLFELEEGCQIARKEVGGGVHFMLPGRLKAPFRRFVKRNSLLEDLAAMVAVLNAIRYYMGLPLARPGSMAER